MTRFFGNVRTPQTAPEPPSDSSTQDEQATPATTALARAMDSTAHQRFSDAVATYRRLTAELDTRQRNAELPEFWGAEASRERESLASLESEANLITYLLNRYAMVEDRYYRTLNSSEQAALLRTQVTELTPTDRGRQNQTVSAGLQSSPSISVGSENVSEMGLEELERANARLAEQCAEVVETAQEGESAVKLEEEALALRLLVATKESETRALKTLFLKYGAIRSVSLSKMSERQRRDVFLKGARDMAREKLEQTRAERNVSEDLPNATKKPSEDKPADDLYAGLGDGRGRFAAQDVSDKLEIMNSAAKKMLQDAARRGVLVALPNGWYKLRTR
jgi:hypothetical protein